MRTITRACFCIAAMVATATVAKAQPTGSCFDLDSCSIGTDRPASVLFFPKVRVNPDQGVDTVIQLVNTSEDNAVGVRCSYINANGHCSNNGTVCESNAECSGGTCVAGWSETDFRVTLTKLQPISWNASKGLSFLPCDFISPDRANCTGRNDGRIPPVPEDRFVGELKCIQVDDSDAPVDFNEIVGQATTVRVDGGSLDASKYNAIGVQGIPGANNHDNTLCLGGEQPTDACPEGAEYAGCPQTLIMDHFFEGSAPDGATVSNTLTLVPCSEDLLNSNPATSTPSITVQILVFNEFEQRISTSVRVKCFADIELADVGSVFSAATNGTVSGQTRLSAVTSTVLANGVLGILEEHSSCGNGPDGFCTAAINLHQQGRRSRSDIIQLP